MPMRCNFTSLTLAGCRSQWQRGLRHESAAAGLLGLWVRTPPGAWLSVSCECCVLSGRVLCVGLVAHPEGSYRLWCDWVWSWILDNEEALAHWGLLLHGKKKSFNRIMTEEWFWMTFSETLIKYDRKSRRFSEISVRNYSDFTASYPRRPLLSFTILFNAVCLKRFVHGTVFLAVRNHGILRERRRLCAHVRCGEGWLLRVSYLLHATHV
jgi:hypothetical protein